MTLSTLLCTICLYWGDFSFALSFVIVAFYFLSHESENYCFNLIQVQVYDSVPKFVEMIF